MICEIQEIMEKNEQYARGWVRLFKTYTPESALMAQYAIDLMKLKHKHQEGCDICQGNQ